jgi:hypothetical protein
MAKETELLAVALGKKLNVMESAFDEKLRHVGPGPRRIELEIPAVESQPFVDALDRMAAMQAEQRTKDMQFFTERIAELHRGMTQAVERFGKSMAETSEQMNRLLEMLAQEEPKREKRKIKFEHDGQGNIVGVREE